MWTASLNHTMNGMPLPKSAAIAEGADVALGRHACTCQKHGFSLLFRIIGYFQCILRWQNIAERFFLVSLQLDCLNMQNDKHTVNYRPCSHIADNVCSGDAPSLAETLAVCPAFSKLFLRKCADYLAVCRIRVTHILSPRASTSRHNNLLTINALARVYPPPGLSRFILSHIRMVIYHHRGSWRWKNHTRRRYTKCSL